MATLDHIAEGRFILGLGLGYRPEESEAFNTSMAHRAARSTEALDLMVRLWTEEVHQRNVRRLDAERHQALIPDQSQG